MSYDIEIVDPDTKEVLRAEEKHDVKGGTHAWGGTDELWINITYNYSPFYADTIGENGIRTLYGMNVKDSIPILENAVNQLGTEQSQDYWEATPGNAGAALQDMLKLAELSPDNGIWDGD